MNLNLGAWTHRIPGYLSVDADPNVAPDVLAAVPPVPAEDGSAKHLYAGHFLEHLAPWDGLDDAGHFFSLGPSESEDSAAMKASCGTSTRPTIFIRFLPSFCFSNSLRLRVMSPP